MLSAIRRFFDDEIDTRDDGGPAVRDERLQLATCALLLETARADDDYDDAEHRAVVEAIVRQFGLPEDRVARLLALAEAERDESTDLYQFTRLIRERFERPEVLSVVAALWRVVWSDGVLESREDALMHKVGNLLGVEHRELMALKVRARREADAAD